MNDFFTNYKDFIAGKSGIAENTNFCSKLAFTKDGIPWGLGSIPHRFGEVVSRFSIQARRQMRVNVPGDRHAAMAQPLRHDLEVNSSFEQSAGVEVAEAVQLVIETHL